MIANEIRKTEVFRTHVKARIDLLRADEELAKMIAKELNELFNLATRVNIPISTDIVSLNAERPIATIEDGSIKIEFLG